jgi:hypothetical protein
MSCVINSPHGGISAGGASFVETIATGADVLNWTLDLLGRVKKNATNPVITTSEMLKIANSQRLN